MSINTHTCSGLNGNSFHLLAGVFFFLSYFSERRRQLAGCVFNRGQNNVKPVLPATAKKKSPEIKAAESRASS